MRQDQYEWWVTEQAKKWAVEDGVVWEELERGEVRARKKEVRANGQFTDWMRRLDEAFEAACVSSI